jgi:hypothetical protein
MTDIDQLLDKAASDARKSVRPKAPPQSSDIERRARRRYALLATTSVLVIGVVTAATLLIVQPGGEVASSEDEALITSELILEDGVVTEEEYRAGALAVAVCATNAGIETEVTFDDVDGSPEWFTNDAPTEKPGPLEECFETHLSHNVSLGRAAALGRLDLEELRGEDTAVVSCVEERSGEDFGDLNYDKFGYLTEQGQDTRDAAFEYEDHQPWGRCRNDLGYEEDQKAENRAIFECVEAGTGEDFGELEFDDTGHLTQASQQTLNLAFHYQDDQPWETCRIELGYPNRTITSDK